VVCFAFLSPIIFVALSPSPPLILGSLAFALGLLGITLFAFPGTPTPETITRIGLRRARALTRGAGATMILVSTLAAIFVLTIAE
jgi:hypothetical protein